MKEKAVEYTFCMKQFKPAVVSLAFLVVIVLAWTGWHCTREKARAMHFTLAAAATPPASPIKVNNKMNHPYWGNCNKCHVTVDAGKPISKVMAGAPISIKQKMTHKYWGNCLLCHKVTDGFQPKKAPPRALAAAQRRLTAQSIGLKVQTVTTAMKRQFGLANEDGAFVLDVAPNSIAAQAGLRKGDEIMRVGKDRVEGVPAFEAALNRQKPGSSVKINIYRGKKNRNLMAKLPEQLWGDLVPAAATAPMTQNQIETLAEQLGVPKTQQDVTRALQRQKQAQAAAAPMTQNQIETLAEQLGVPKTQQDVTRALQQQKQARLVAAMINSGKAAVGAMGPGLNYTVSSRFGTSPYFVVFDPQRNSYKVVANPNANDVLGSGIQTGQYMVDLGVSNVVVGGIEPDALQTLNTLKINAYSGVTGTVSDVLSAYVNGGLTPAQTNLNLWARQPGGNVPPAGGGGFSAQPGFQPIY